MFEQSDVPHLSVPQAVILDFDRTLGDVDDAMERFRLAAQRCGITATAFLAARLKVEADGGTFEPLSFIREQFTKGGHFNEPAYRSFCQVYINLAAPTILYDDASRFLDLLQHSGVPHSVMTYGVSLEWQRLKIAAAGYPAGVDILDHTRKGHRLADLRGREGYLFERRPQGNKTSDLVIAARSIVLIDDKPSAFIDLPEGVTGILVRRGAAIPSQNGPVPDGVATVGSLDELTVDSGGRIGLGSRTRASKVKSQFYRYLPIFNA